MRVVALTLVLLLAGCAAGPRQMPPPVSTEPGSQGTLPAPPQVRPGPANAAERDGLPTELPAALHLVPDAQPQVEPLRQGGPNKPYEVLGERYTPEVADVAVRERGLASWYGRKFHGRRTASGEVYDMFAMSAAHKTMPIPSYARVRNPANGREVVVRVNDRGPFHAGRIIDLSYTAALKLGVLAGVAPVEVERLTHDDIRSGLWQRQGPLPMPQPLGGIDPLMALAERADAAVPLPNPAAPPEAPAQPAPTKAAAGYWLQLGAFSQREGALAMRQQVAQQLDWLAPLLAVFTEKQQHRLQAGPYASREQAAAAAARLREAGRVGVLVLQRTAR